MNKFSFFLAIIFGVLFFVSGNNSSISAKESINEEDIQISCQAFMVDMKGQAKYIGTYSSVAQAEGYLGYYCGTMSEWGFPYVSGKIIRTVYVQGYFFESNTYYFMCPEIIENSTPVNSQDLVYEGVYLSLANLQ